MQTENIVLMRAARKSLEGKWGLAIGTFVVYGVIAVVISLIPEVVQNGIMLKPGTFLSLFITGAFRLGISIFTLAIIREQDPKLEQIFEGFKNYGTSLGAYFLTLIFTVLWTLLLIIPGIIAAISYSQTFYIIADNPSVGAMAAIDQSKAMMEGYKAKYFRMGLRLFGLALLCLLTLGIGFFWLVPYAEVCMAKFYQDLKGDYEGVQELTPADVL